jgi:hypothetical protein
MPVLPRLGLIVVVACFSAVAASADAPTFLGLSKNWSAYQATTSDGKVCYALAKPEKVLPAKAARDPIFLMVSDWPGRNVEGELEVVPGYPYKAGEPVVGEVGSLKVNFFTQNDGGTGAAWVKDRNDELSLLDAMKKANTIVIKGISQRGTHTSDTYSLDGISAMLDKVHESCGK